MSGCSRRHSIQPLPISQAEWLATGRRVPARTRWVLLLAGYFALARTIVLAWCTSVGSKPDSAADEQLPIVPLVAYPLVAVTAMLALLVLPFFLRLAERAPFSRWTLVVYLIPAQLPLAMPCGFFLGILWALRGARASRRSAAAIVAAAVICSAGMLATTVWLMPYSNQSFRVATGTPDRIPTGAAELSLRELSEQIRTRAADGLPTESLKHVYHLRLALPFATLALAFLTLSLTGRRPNARVRLTLALVVACAVVSRSPL